MKPETVEKKKRIYNSLIELKKYQEAAEYVNCNLGLSGRLKCRTNIMIDFKLKLTELKGLACVTAPNPHYKTGSVMYLYLIDEVVYKYGTPEGRRKKKIEEIFGEEIHN